MRSRAEGAYEARTLRVRNAFHNHRPPVLAQLVKHRLQRSRYNLCRSHRLCCRFRCRCSLRRCALRCPLRGRPAHRPSRRTSCCASSRTASCSAAVTASRFACRSHRLRSRRTALPSPSGTCDFRLLSLQRTALQQVATSDAAQSAYLCAYCVASSCPVSGTPTGSADDCPSHGLHHRRAGDRPGSWPRREPSA